MLNYKYFIVFTLKNLLNRKHDIINQVTSLNYINVRSTQVNLNNQLGLYGVLGMLQDIAAEHASYLGFGYKQLVQKSFF